MANTHEGKFVHDVTEPPKSDRLLSLLSLAGKTAIVSGAGAGIGLAVAQGFAEAGANVAIWYNSNRKAIDKAAEMEKTYGVKCRAYQVNITSYEAVEEGIKQAVRDLNGRLDIFVANSGIAWEDGPLLDGPVDKAEKVMRVNLDGTVYTARAVGKHFRRQKQEGTTIDGRPLQGYTYGSFIATASMSGLIVNIPQLQAVYNASKAAVIQLCKSLAVEWVGFARANSIAPGYMETEISNFASAEVRKVWKDKIPMGYAGPLNPCNIFESALVEL